MEADVSSESFSEQQDLEKLCMETLFACAYLWAWGLADKKDYLEILDELFAESPENACLLELEGLAADYRESFFRIKQYFDYETGSFDTERFGRSLFAGLEKAYFSGKWSMAEFAKRVYEIWSLLPGDIMHEEPFFSLMYADDPLSWGDEEETRRLYEEAFSYYKT